MSQRPAPRTSSLAGASVVGANDTDSGHSYAGRAVGETTRRGSSMSETRRRYRRRRGPGGLTRREQEVLALVAAGATNRAVAKLLWVTDETVKFHLSNVYRRLAVRSRAEATEWAVANGLLDSGYEPRLELVPAI